MQNGNFADSHIFRDFECDGPAFSPTPRQPKAAALTGDRNTLRIGVVTIAPK